MKVLIIDDIEDTVKGIIDNCEENKWEYQLVGFDKASAALLDFNPDVIVLDWCEDAEKINTGEYILNKIWDIAFRPVLVFSANAYIIDVKSKLDKSKMLTVVPKGDETPVIDFLKDIEKFVNALSEYRSNMSSALIESMNSIYHFKNDSEIEESAIGYILSKRTSAFFDDKYISSISPSWVQYLCPPLGTCLSVCDIIRVNNNNSDMHLAGKPEEYCMILTPSCDLYHSEGRLPKVTHALCAHCFPKEKFHGHDLSDNPSNSKISSVKTKLNAGYNENFVPLPGFSDVLPYMTADLKKIELIPLNEIAVNISSITDEIKYIRIASICSPFREQIVWAHLQNSCRPGVPDRNTELWAKELLTK